MVKASSSSCKQSKRQKSDVVIFLVLIQFLSDIVPLAEIAGFTPFLLQLLALHPSTCLVSGHPPSNQSSLSPLPLASIRSSLVILAFSCHSLDILMKSFSLFFTYATKVLRKYVCMAFQIVECDTHVTIHFFRARQ